MCHAMRLQALTSGVTVEYVHIKPNSAVVKASNLYRFAFTPIHVRTNLLSLYLKPYMTLSPCPYDPISLHLKPDMTDAAKARVVQVGFVHGTCAT